MLTSNYLNQLWNEVSVWRAPFVWSTKLLNLINSKITVCKNYISLLFCLFSFLGSLIIIWESQRTKRKKLTLQVFISRKHKFKYMSLYTESFYIDYSGLDALLECLFTFFFSYVKHIVEKSFSYFTTASNEIGSITNSHNIHIIHIDMLASPVWMYFKLGMLA